MRMFSGKVGSKSWSVNVCSKCDEAIIIEAVDTYTGERVAELIRLGDGKVIAYRCAKNALEARGYDPYEHGNSYDESGGIVLG